MKRETTAAILDLFKAFAVIQQSLERKITAAELVLLDHTLEPGQEEGSALYRKYLLKVGELAEEPHAADGSSQQISKLIEDLQARLLLDHS